MGTVALPFTHLTFKPRNPAYPEHIETCGDHIRKRRLDLGLLQRDVAVVVNATLSTVTNWEKKRCTPRLCLLPKIHKFLGQISVDSNATSLGEQITQYRIREGLSLRKMGKVLMIDPGTLAKWEKGGSEPQRKRRACVMRILHTPAGEREHFEGWEAQ